MRGKKYPSAPPVVGHRGGGMGFFCPVVEVAIY